MGIEFDWTGIRDLGGIGLCVVLLLVGFKGFTLVMEQWKNSTDAVNKNTEAFMELSKVFERSHEREVEFQAEMRERFDASEERQKDTLRIQKDTLRKVNEIHENIL